MSIEHAYSRPKAILAFSLPLLCCLAGCGPDKSALTESELRRIAIAEKIQLVEASGGLVLTVGGETVTSDQIIESQMENSSGQVLSLAESLKPAAQTATLEQFKQRAAARVKDVLMREISNILLYQYAKRQAGENIDEALDKAAEKELRKFVLSFGGDEARADEALGKMGLDQNSFKDRQKRFLLTQSYLSSKLPHDRPITYAELVANYEKMKDEFFYSPGALKFRLIDIEPDKMRITDPNQDPLGQARGLADRLVRQLNSGEDFDKLVEQHADAGISASGIQWKPYNPDSLVPPYDMVAREAEQIEAGRIAGPIEAPGHIFIVKLESKQAHGYEPFEKVQRQVERKVIYDRQNEVLTKIEARLLDQAAIGETDEFTDFCLQRIYEMSRS